MFNLFAIIGAMAYRWRGSGDTTSQVFRRAVCVSLLLVPAYPLAGYIELALLFALTYLGVIVGHGRYYTLGRGPYPLRGDNWPGLLIERIKPTIDRTVHDWLALAITGLCFTAPLAGFMVYQSNIIAALIAVVAGLAKPIAYELGWRFAEYRKATDPIILCELFNGALLGAAIWLMMEA